MNRLKQVAEKIVNKEILQELCQWYEHILHEEREYIVFIVRRSYMLALLLEKMTGKKMEENSKAIFLTDASLILQCRSMADIYIETGRFPSILLCDELLLHGRNLNHLIDAMENRLVACLPDCDPKDIRRRLAAAVKIYVYARTEQEVLLYGRYEERMEYMRRENAGFLHSFSGSISEWILCSGFSNASYVFSRLIDEAMMTKIQEKEKLIGTKYQNTVQYTSVSLLGGGNRKKAVLSLRFVKTKEGEGYRAIPFVFLPNLDTDVTDKLLNEVKQRTGNEDFHQIMEALAHIPGRRTLNELLTMLFSHVVLLDFLERYQIDIQPNAETEQELVCEEILKLARNYNFDTLEHAKGLLKELLFRKLFAKEEMEAVFERVIPDDYKVLEVSADPRTRKTLASQESVVRRLESYFYNKGWQEEAFAYRMTQMPYYISPRRSERRVRGCCFILSELCGGFEEQETGICISCFLQMMDAGVLSLSSYAPNSMDVVGYAQFAKAGELSLLLEPLRYYEYIPMLALIQSECGKWNIDLKKEIERFTCRMEQGFDSNRIEEIVNFIHTLEMIGQKADEWDDEGYLRKIQFNSEQERQAFVTRQSALKEAYQRYLRSML